jgi:hypothetical protein
MNLYQYITNQPLLTFLVLLMGSNEESINYIEPNILTDCEMTKFRTRTISLSRYDEEINVDEIDENLRKRDMSPSNKYYRSILKNNKPGVVLQHYEDIEYE